jgi:hypothetical protein
MARKRYKPEEIVAKLRQVDVLVSQGQNMMDAIRHLLWRAAGDNVAVFGQLRDQLWKGGDRDSEDPQRFAVQSTAPFKTDIFGPFLAAFGTVE